MSPILQNNEQGYQPNNQFPLNQPQGYDPNNPGNSERQGFARHPANFNGSGGKEITDE